MNNHLTPETTRLLESLFAREPEGQSYRLTLLKKLSQSTKPTKVRECIKDFQTIVELHEKLIDILGVLKLGHAGTRYYAGSVMRSQIFQIHRRSFEDRYIHATAFVAYQYYRMQDNLIDIFSNVMAAFQTTVANERKEKALNQQEIQQTQFKTLVQNLEIGIFSIMNEIRSIANHCSLPDSEKVSLIKEALDREPSGSAQDIREEFLEISGDFALYDFQEGRSLRLQNRLSPVLKVVNFHSEQPKSLLMKGIDYFRDKDGHITEHAPTSFLTESEQKALYKKDGAFRPSLYKVFLFQHVAAAIRSGKLNLLQSYKYRPLDEYIVKRPRWEKEKYQLLERAELLDFLDLKNTLHELDHALYEQYQTTNANIMENEFIKFKTNGAYCVKTPPSREQEPEICRTSASNQRGLRDLPVSPLQEWFPKRQYISLAEILDTVHRHSDMLSAFKHWQRSRTLKTASRPALLACIIGLGCRIGLRKMARISSNVNENELDHVVN